jgi:hypothetical protein
MVISSVAGLATSSNFLPSLTQNKLAKMFGLGSKHIVNAFNLWVVVFVALGTLSTAYGLAIIGSTVGQPNCQQLSC